MVFRRYDLTSPHAVGDNIDASRAVSLRFLRGIASFLVVAGLSLPLGILPFRCLDLCCFWAYFFPRLTSLHFSPSHLALRHPRYCYCLWSHIGDHWRHIESPPLKFHLNGLVLTPQPTCWFSLASTFGLVLPAPRTPLLSGSVLAL